VVVVAVGVTVEKAMALGMTVIGVVVAGVTLLIPVSRVMTGMVVIMVVARMAILEVWIACHCLPLAARRPATRDVLPPLKV
jgi:hypothetical protein